MKSFDYLLVRYWSIEINWTGCGFGPRSHHHLDHTLPGFKKRGQLLQSKRTEGACIATRLRLHSQSRLARPLGLPLQAAAATRRRRDAVAAARHAGRKLAKCRAPKAS